MVAFSRSGAHRCGRRSEPGGQVRQNGLGNELELRRLLSADEVAEFLGVPVRTLYQWRYKGAGPVGVRVGRHLRYRVTDIEAWIDGQVAVDGRPRAG
jgi:excisionase family DNA binding protein